MSDNKYNMDFAVLITMLAISFCMAVAIIALLVGLMGAATPPPWLTSRFDPSWYVEMQPGDVIYYLDDNRDLHSLIFDGVNPDGSCMFGLDDVSMGVHQRLYEPETEVLPWRGCNVRTGLMLVWSSPTFRTPGAVKNFSDCYADIDATETYTQTCDYQENYATGHDKELIELIEYDTGLTDGYQ